MGERLHYFVELRKLLGKKLRICFFLDFKCVGKNDRDGDLKIYLFIYFNLFKVDVLHNNNYNLHIQREGPGIEAGTLTIFNAQKRGFVIRL